MGAIDPGRWQFWQARSRIGATSLENVASLGAVSAASAANCRRHTTDPKIFIIATSFGYPENSHLFYRHGARNTTDWSNMAMDHVDAMEVGRRQFGFLPGDAGCLRPAAQRAKLTEQRRFLLLSAGPLLCSRLLCAAHGEQGCSRVRAGAPPRLRRTWAVAPGGKRPGPGELHLHQPGFARHRASDVELHSHRIADTARMGHARLLHWLERGGLFRAGPQGARHGQDPRRIECSSQTVRVKSSGYRDQAGRGQSELSKGGVSRVLL